MSVILNTNMMSLSISHALNNNYTRLESSTARLSSGLRINKASDDASGYAIRELMRSEIGMLEQGKRNANDAISLAQTADGALGVIDAKLIRMKELAEQAATGSYDSIQRDIINNEYQTVADEITRIANATDFNGLKLLDGSLEGPMAPATVLPPTGQAVTEGGLKIHFGSGNDSAEDYFSIEIGEVTASALGLGATAGDDPNVYAADSHTAQSLDQFLENSPGGVTLSGAQVKALEDAWLVDQDRYLDKYTAEPFASLEAFMKAPIEQGGLEIDINLNQLTGNAALSAAEITDIRNDIASSPSAEKAGTAPYGTEEDPIVNPAVAAESYTVFEEMLKGLDPTQPFTMTDAQGDELAAAFEEDRTLFLKADGTEFASFAEFATASAEFGGLGFKLSMDHFSASAGGVQTDGSPAYVGTPDIPTNPPQLGIPGDDAANAINPAELADIQDELDKVHSSFSLVPGNNILTQDNARNALEVIDAAIQAKDHIRAELGAVQNRLETTVEKLTIQRFNLQAAESRISDAEIAEEMTDFVRHQTLTQAGVSILSQANALPQTMLQLLNG